jgi:hypothetical protein
MSSVTMKRAGNGRVKMLCKYRQRLVITKSTIAGISQLVQRTHFNCQRWTQIIKYYELIMITLMALR